jgi:peptidyl-prolyl cis-trans isomerase B (cyclophilin B)
MKIAEELYVPSYKPHGKEEAVFTTNKGVIRVRLSGHFAPVNVGNFIELVQDGFYDGLKFHAQTANGMIDTGNPMTRNLSSGEVTRVARNRWGGMDMGTPGYRIQGEFENNPGNKHNAGALAMRRLRNPNTAGCLIYFCQKPQHQLDRTNTVIGQTIEGLDVVRSLKQGDVIESVAIEHIHLDDPQEAEPQVVRASDMKPADAQSDGAEAVGDEAAGNEAVSKTEAGIVGSKAALRATAGAVDA